MDFSSTTVLPFAAMGAGALAVALSYTALLPGAGRSYRWWAAAYAATAARWIMITLAAAGVWSAGALLAQGLQIASALLLLGGTLVFLGRRPSPGAIAAGAALAAAWPIGALAFSGAPWPAWPLYLAGGLVHLGTGAVYVVERRRRDRLHGAFFMIGALFAALGVLKLTTAILGGGTDGAVSGFALYSHALHLLLAVVLIVTVQRHQQLRAEDARRELRRSEERFRDFADIASDWYWEMGADLRFSYFSERMGRSTGLDPQKVIGRRRGEMEGVDHDDPVLVRHLAELEAHRPFRDFRYRYRDTAGRPRWISVSGRPMHDDHGTFLGYRGVGRDITAETTARQEIDEARQAAEMASRAKSEFLANISHELRTPLNAIIGFSEIIRDLQFGRNAIDRYADYAADIHASGTHLLDVINDVLDMAKIEAGRYQLHEEPLDLAPLVDSCRRIIDGRAREKALRLIIELPADPPRLLADKRAMKQILINLLSNAVKFTPEGGEIRVSISLTPVEAGTGLRLDVADTGIGIAEKDLAYIREPFRQADTRMSRSFEGTGLGLTIVGSLIELHDGTLDIASRLGEGTTVTIRLPPGRVIEAGLGGEADPSATPPVPFALLGDGGEARSA